MRKCTPPKLAFDLWRDEAFLPCGEDSEFIIGRRVVAAISGRAKTVIVGDHNLIDVVVENDRLAVLTAKDKPGLTNIIVLDKDGGEIFAAPVTVVPPATVAIAQAAATSKKMVGAREGIEP
jgi:Flp pilus assembly secretin CpaC